MRTPLWSDCPLGDSLRTNSTWNVLSVYSFLHSNPILLEFIQVKITTEMMSLISIQENHLLF